MSGFTHQPGTTPNSLYADSPLPRIGIHASGTESATVAREWVTEHLR